MNRQRLFFRILLPVITVSGVVFALPGDIHSSWDAIRIFWGPKEEIEPLNVQHLLEECVVNTPFRETTFFIELTSGLVRVPFESVLEALESNGFNPTSNYSRNLKAFTPVACAMAHGLKSISLGHCIDHGEAPYLIFPESSSCANNRSIRHSPSVIPSDVKIA